MIKKIKILITIKLLLLAFSSLNAQTTYYHEFENSINSFTSYGASLSENEQILVVAKMNINDTLSSYLYKLNVEGHRVDSFEFSGKKTSGIMGVLIHNELIYCIGLQFNSLSLGDYEYVFICLSKNLKPLITERYEASIFSYYSCKLKLVNDTTIGFSFGDYENDMFNFWEFNLQGDTLRTYSNFENGIWRVFDFAPKYDQTGFYMTSHRIGGIDPMQDSWGVLYELNNDFQVLDSISFKGWQKYKINIDPYKYSQYLVGGSTYQGVFGLDPSGHTNFIGIKFEFAIDKIDAYGNNIATCTPYEVNLANAEDSIFYSFQDKTISFHDPNRIYGGTYIGFPFSQDFMIFCCDSNLNVKWRKFYHTGEAEMRSVIATKDGGVLVCGNKKVGFERSIGFYMKIDSTGAFVSTKELPFAVSNAAVYPNPGTVNMHVSAGPQILDGLFQVFDISGRLVLEQKINTTEMDINTSHWNKGTYVWRIIYKGKQVDEGKWIKQ